MITKLKTIINRHLKIFWYIRAIFILFWAFGFPFILIEYKNSILNTVWLIGIFYGLFLIWRNEIKYGSEHDFYDPM